MKIDLSGKTALVTGALGGSAAAAVPKERHAAIINARASITALHQKPECRMRVNG
jgi:hypothetical protein